MPLGRTAQRDSRTIVPIGVAAVLILAGCSAMPPAATRLIPRSADIRTRTQPDGPASADAAATEPPAKTKLAFDTLDEVSPLPPALQPPNTPLELPPSLPTLAEKADAPKPEAAPLIDQSLRQASARSDETTTPAAAEITAKPSPAIVPTVKPETPPEVKVAAPAPISAAPPVSVAPVPVAKLPDDVWREGVQTLRAVARDRLKEASKEIKPGSPNWAVRERLLGWLAEPDIDPDARTSSEVAQGRAVLKGLAAVLDPTGPSLTRGAEIREAIATLEAQSPLEITELKLCRMVHGFGNIEALEPPSRKAGQPVVLYCELAGLAYEPSGPSFRSRVSAEVELLLEGTSEKPAWTHALGTAEDACRRRRRDFFVGHRFTLPETLAAGNYRLRLTERDLVTDHVATRETGITITR